MHEISSIYVSQLLEVIGLDAYLYQKVVYIVSFNE